MGKLRFQDVVSDISHGAMDEDDEEVQDSPETPEVEESPDPDKVAEDPDTEAESEDEDEEEVQSDEPEGEDEDEESEEDAEDSDDEPEEPTVEIDGEQVPVSQVRAWRDGNLRQEDYTRKTQDLATRAKALEKERQEMQSLADSIAGDKFLQKFLAAHPEAISHLMAEPQGTKALLGNADAVNQFWQEYEVLLDNPGIASKLAHTGQKPPEVEEEAQVRSAVAVAGALKYAVEEVGKQYPDVDREAVENYLLELGGVDPQNPPQDKRGVIQSMARLYQLMFMVDGDQTYVNPRLIRDRFEALAAASEKHKKTADKKAEEHNKKVDAALKETDDQPPKTPKGKSPAPSREEEPMPGDFRSALDDILGY